MSAPSEAKTLEADDEATGVGVEEKSDNLVIGTRDKIAAAIVDGGGIAVSFLEYFAAEPDDTKYSLSLEKGSITKLNK